MIYLYFSSITVQFNNLQGLLPQKVTEYASVINYVKKNETLVRKNKILMQN